MARISDTPEWRFLMSNLVPMQDITDECSEFPDFDNHKEVFFFFDVATGLLGAGAVHSFEWNNDLKKCVASGGTRRWTYGNLDDLLTDVLRLSRGMSYKSAWAGTQSGGSKFVLWDKPGQEVSEEYLKSFADVLDRYHGSIRTGEDIGVSMEMVDRLSRYTRYIFGSSKISGDPSPFTAHGVIKGMEECLWQQFARSSQGGLVFRNVSVAVQGLGKVGRDLVRRLMKHGARLYVADINETAVEDVMSSYKDGAITAVAPNAIHKKRVDIFAPCAMGGILNEKTIPELGCRIVCGSANNQLSRHEDGVLLHERGILYAPDYIVNAGGLINVSQETHPKGYDAKRSFEILSKRIPDNLRSIFTMSYSLSGDESAPSHIADNVAEQKFSEL